MILISILITWGVLPLINAAHIFMHKNAETLYALNAKLHTGWHEVGEPLLTSPSQLLMATEAFGMSVTSPVNTQSPSIRSLACSSKSSCHWTKAPGATSLLLALRRKCSSFPNTVTLKNSCCPFKAVWGVTGASRGTRFLPEGDALAESTWDTNRPRASVLNGTIRPNSLNLPERFPDKNKQDFRSH